MTEKCRFYWDLIMNLDSKYTIMKNNAGKRFERAVNEKYMLVKSINKSDRTTRFLKVSRIRQTFPQDGATWRKVSEMLLPYRIGKPGISM